MSASSTSAPRAENTTDRRRAGPHRIIAAYDIFLGSGLLVGIWAGLPDRWWPVDTIGTALGSLLVIVGLGLALRQRWAEPAALAIAAVTCAAGAMLVTALAITAGQLAGMYGPVGLGGSAILATAFLLLVPYLVVFPAAQVYFLLRIEAERVAAASSSEDAELPRGA
ncbi:MAG: hypothetical protein H5U40_01035 [Polyangiaceae bacterium]|nr:hypothetical protein [Polyangiaceae bacterium]